MQIKYGKCGAPLAFPATKSYLKVVGWGREPHTLECFYSTKVYNLMKTQALGSLAETWSRTCHLLNSTLEKKSLKILLDFRQIISYFSSMAIPEMNLFNLLNSGLCLRKELVLLQCNHKHIKSSFDNRK